MKKTLWLFLLLAQVVSGKVLSAKYEVSFGILQTMGIAETKFEQNDDNTYRIYVSAKTTGVAKFLSNNRVEIYESRGIVKDGRLIPSVFIKIRQTNSNKMVKTLFFSITKLSLFKKMLKARKTIKVKINRGSYALTFKKCYVLPTQLNMRYTKLYLL